MNEHITELADQAGIEFTPDYAHWGTEVTPLQLEKFAELIVKEMCDMMRQCQTDCDTGDASETHWGYISQLQGWIDRFERHFGVEQ